MAQAVMRPRFTEDVTFSDALVDGAFSEGMKVHTKHACDVIKSGKVACSVALARDDDSYFAIVASGTDFETYDLFTECPKEAREQFVLKAIEVGRDCRW